MDIKTQRELAFFMAGIECGRMFKLIHMSTSKHGVWFETQHDETGLVINLPSGFMGYEGCDDEWPNDLRHPALRGILADAQSHAKSAFELKREILKEREKMLNGGEQ